MHAALARFEVDGEVADVGFIVEALTVEGDRSGSEIEVFRLDRLSETVTSLAQISPPRASRREPISSLIVP